MTLPIAPGQQYVYPIDWAALLWDLHSVGVSAAELERFSAKAGLPVTSYQIDHYRTGLHQPSFYAGLAIITAHRRFCRPITSIYASTTGR